MPRPSDPFSPPRKRPAPHSLQWIFEPLERMSGFNQRRMFGCLAAYIDDTLCLVIADRGDPWNGLLICTSQEHHTALMARFPAVHPHEVLGKWLYLAQDEEQFEEIALQITDCVRDRDPLIGVAPKPARRRRAS